MSLTICLKELNFNKLLRENSFIVSNKLALNDYTISVTSLADSETNDLIFINTRLVIDLTRFFNTRLVKLLKIYDIRDLNDQLEKAFTHVIILNL